MRFDCLVMLNPILGRAVGPAIHHPSQDRSIHEQSAGGRINLRGGYGLIVMAVKYLLGRKGKSRPNGCPILSILVVTTRGPALESGIYQADLVACLSQNPDVCLNRFDSFDLRCNG